MKNLCIAVALTAAVAVGIPTTASACRLPLPERVPEIMRGQQAAALEAYGLIYLAEVEAVNFTQPGITTYTLRTRAVLKGQDAPPTTILSSQPTDRWCSPRFGDEVEEGAEAGQRFLVYAQWTGGDREETWTQLETEILDPATQQALKDSSGAVTEGDNE